MKNNHLRYIPNSISFKLLLSICLCVVPMVALLIYNNQQSHNVLLSQVDSTHRNMLQIYTVQLDSQLNSASSYLANLALYENDPQIIALSGSESAVKLATMRVKNDMDDRMLTNNFLDGYFLWVEEKSGYVTFYNCVNPLHPITPGDDLKAFIKEQAISEGTNFSWQFRHFRNKDYLFLIVGKDGIYTGAYISLDNLISEFEPSDVPGSHLAIIPPADEASYLLSLPEGIQSIAVRSESADLLMMEHFSRNEITKILPLMQQYSWLISTLLFLLVIVLLVLVKHIVTDPLIRLVAAMHHIEDGNLDYRMPPEHASVELALVSSTFNQMIGEIQNLKINIYEQQLNVQKAQLRNLQLQIKPHFLINSLNMVYNLMGTSQIPLARKLIQHSIDFFRYMVHVDEHLVPLHAEINHVKAYLDIQSVRYQDQFIYSLEVDPTISDMLIPPVLIQGLVENSMKYGLSLDSILRIDIRITAFEKEYFPYARIEISDSGSGFSEDILEKLNAGKKILREDGSHIGIHNITQRLRFLFGDNASWEFKNRNGAVNTITIPATFSDTALDSPD
ncbi:MAG TPA: histidine kinase [Clostridiales bacterium]|nr:histidine kinase [Clostridiales bacterium]